MPDLKAKIEGPNDLSDSLAPLCGHGSSSLVYRRSVATCSLCGSFWDLKSAKVTPSYDGSYPEKRRHFDKELGRCKQRSLEGFLRRSNSSIKNLRVCEVGFGAGQTLKFLSSAGAKEVFGIEAIPENIAHARSLGIPSEHLFHVDSLPPVVGRKIDFWIFLDSFEHIPDPAKFIGWLKKNSSTHAKILLVAPNAESLSSRWMSSWWLHRIPDHTFHWSSRGITGFLSQHGFSELSDFYPAKFVSPQVVFLHFAIFSRLELFTKLAKALPSFPLKFNIGEMGKVFELR